GSVKPSESAAKIAATVRKSGAIGSGCMTGRIMSQCRSACQLENLLITNPVSRLQAYPELSPGAARQVDVESAESTRLIAVSAIRSPGIRPEEFEFELLEIEFQLEKIEFRPWENEFESLEIEFQAAEIEFLSLEIEFRLAEIEFLSLEIDFQGEKLGDLGASSDLGPAAQIHFARWCRCAPYPATMPSRAQSGAQSGAAC